MKSSSTCFVETDTMRRLVTVIERKDPRLLADLAELWKFRELLSCLVWREFRVRYKETVLGAAWAILQPLALMIVFTLFFTRLGGSAAADVPYSLYVFLGLLPWTFFAGTVSAAGLSIVGRQNLISKIYFPRLLLPMSAVGMGLIDFSVASLMVPVLMLCHRAHPGWGICLFPVAVLGLTACALGVGCLLAALTVSYRDFQFVVPFLVQIWMFATPGIYLHADAIPLDSRWLPLLALNPAEGLIINLRASLLNQPIDLPTLGVSLVMSFAVLLGGCAYFRRQERYFADIV